MKKGNRKRVAVMHWKDPHCYWCGIETVFTVPGRKEGVSYRVPANMATLDHIYSKLFPELRKKAPRAWVLACNGCNKFRAEVETKFHSPNKREKALRALAHPGRVFIRDPFEHMKELILQQSSSGAVR